MKSPHSPTKYLGPNVFMAPTVTVNRRPTSTDIYQPTTGKYYGITTLWQVGKNPTTGMEGEVWLLTKIVANVSYWELITGGSTGGTVVGLRDSSGDTVGPDSLGIIDVIGDANSIITTNVDGIIPNTIRVNIKTGQKNASSAIGNAGVVSVNSAQFDIDSNGWITLLGSTGPAATKFVPQTGTSPVIPNASGEVTVNGTVVAAGTNPFRSNGTGANTIALQLQISQAIASTDATKIGLCNFNTAQFTVDPNGFVTLKGGTTPGILFISSDDPTNVGPNSSGVVGLKGTVVANNTNPMKPLFFKNDAANNITGQLQLATTVAPTPINVWSCGVCCFNSDQFNMDAASGMVSLKGTTPATVQFTTTVGGPVNPTSGGVVITTGATSTYTNGSTANTLLTEVQGANHALLIGRGTNTPVTTITPAANGYAVLCAPGTNPSTSDPQWVTTSTSFNATFQNFNGSYTSQAGRWLRFGNMTMVQINMDWTGNSSMGDMRITNMPFVSGAALTHFPGTAVCSGVTLPASAVQIYCDADGNNSQVLKMLALIDGGNPLPVQMSASGTLSITQIYFTVSV